MRSIVAELYRHRMLLLGLGHLATIAWVVSWFLPRFSQMSAIRWGFLVGAIGLYVGSFALSAAGARLFPATDPLIVTSPVRGRWRATNSPESQVPSHGLRMYGQAYAIDLMYEPHQGARPLFPSKHAFRDVNDYPAYGEPVYAMIDGIVVRASCVQRDHRARSNRLSLIYLLIESMVRELGGSHRILGNHVTIRGSNGVYAVVAHLQHDSVRVKVGQEVRAGEFLGRCGNSGHSSEPQVHAQLMDRRSTLTAQGIAMAFANITVADGTTPVAGLPGNGELMVA